MYQLRTLWTFDERSSKSRDAQRAIELFHEARNLVATNEFSTALQIIRKALIMNPRYHALFALRGDIFFQQDKLDLAIHNYEEARKMVKFDKKSASEMSSYVRNLIDVYWKRGLQYSKQARYIEAASDYEQILVLKPYGVVLTEIEDELLRTLRKMDKYEAFRYEWSRFMNDADPSRVSSLLTQHAEYKIYRREMSSARHILFEAIDLDSENEKAHELLQVIYDTGHHLVVFSITWSVYGCHDKALMAIEKARDCDPYNPGYTLLKAIVLRLSGRLLEAVKWLESVDKGFHKLLEPSRDKQGSIMGNLTIEQTRTQLVKQWYLIRYDMAVQFMLEERYNDALKILESSRLREQYAETYTLMGDCMSKLGEPDKALQMYLTSLAKAVDFKTIDPKSRKYIHLVKRITDILNEKCSQYVDDGRSKEAVKIANDVAQVLEKTSDQNSLILGQNLGEAMICKARAQYQNEEVKKTSAFPLLAEGFTLARGVDDHGLYKYVFHDTNLEKVVDNFGRRRILPKSMKLLMQYS
ncbi:uncharacterized protein [Venturia canescens]|uniref:uncharacterized protein n=1 Tax=Venturia canescens TaxID=32260 RepID=UPI001C9C5A28|nr:uncharacterized protein LOC122408569 [Venturia canescens]